MADVPPPPTQKTFKRNAHTQYFLRCLRALPTQAQDNDSNRITIAFFCLSGLDLLGALEEQTTEQQRGGWAEWIWTLQSPSGGFRGSTFMGSDDRASPGHLPSTYTALMCLAILRAPLDRLDIHALSRFLTSCQAQDGSFSPLPPQWMEDGGFQNDLRMTYCAAIVTNVVRSRSFSPSTAIEHVKRCKTWEGGYSSRPGVIEAQGGTSYCSIASRALLSDSALINGDGPTQLDDDDEETTRWLIQRQIGGFQGRPGKYEDVCYSFWIGGALTILGHGLLINTDENTAFLLSAQSPMGGFAKEPGEYPDPYHSYLALAALALMPMTTRSDLRLKPLDVKWNVSDETAAWLRKEVDRVRPAAR